METNQDCVDLKNSLLPHLAHFNKEFFLGNKSDNNNINVEKVFENIFLDLMTGIRDYEEWDKIGLDIRGDGSEWTKVQQFTILAPLRYEDLYNKTADDGHEFWRFLASCHEYETMVNFQHERVPVNSCDEVQKYTAETRSIISSLTAFDLSVLGKLQFRKGTDYVIEKLRNVSSVDDYQKWPFMEFLGDYCLNGTHCNDTTQIDELSSQMIARMMLMIRYKRSHASSSQQ